MPDSIISTVVLKPHARVTGAVRAVTVRLSRERNGALDLSFTVNANLSGLRIPPPKPARRMNGLWEHTCFEAFVGPKNKPEYYEFNFSPSGEWAIYNFRSYREGAPLQSEALEPKIAVVREKGSLNLQAIINVDRLSHMAATAPLRLGLAALIEDKDGMFSYWALKHPAGKPDFHHPDGFALELETANLKGGQAPGRAPTINPGEREFATEKK